jgi:transposase
VVIVGDVERESLERLLAQGLSLEEIGRRFRKHPSTISHWLKKYGLKAVHHEKHAARGGIEREQLERLIEAGRTQREMAAELGVGHGTIRYWLTRFGLRSDAKGRRSHRQQARDDGFLVIQDECSRHGSTDFFLEGRGIYRCKRCRQERVVRRRKRLKEILVAEAGSRCSLCGYDRHIGALHFHHLDPLEKRFSLSERGLTRSLERCRAEAAKCVLLCGNCHAEVEAGLVELAPKH